MATKTPLRSDTPVAPGHYIREALEFLGMSQQELATRMGRPAQAISEILNGKKALTEQTAFELSAVLGKSPSTWMNLEYAYRFNLQRAEQEKALSEQADQIDPDLYRELVKMALVERTRDGAEKARQFLGFLRAANLAAVEKQYASAFRHATKRQPNPLALAAWLRIAEIEAAKQDLPPYDRKKLEAAIEDLRAVTLCEVRPDGAVREVLSRCGVACVFVPHLPKTYAHGATFWQNGHPVVVLSLRGACEDTIWFTLFHEVGHLLLHDKGATFLEGLGATSREENEANEFAGNALIPPDRWHAFFGERSFSRTSVKAFAETIGIAPAIVAGRVLRELDAYGKRPELDKLRRRIKWAGEEPSAA